MMMRGSKWRNWSGIVEASPQTVVYPGSVVEVVQVVNQCRREVRTLRVVGSGHSFTPIAASNDILMSLDGLQGIVRVDMDAQTATVWAGTKLKALGDMLFQHGLAQENLGDIDVQSIAGAISTGTHGTGIEFENIATQVIGLTVVTGAGDILQCTADSHPEQFRALQVSLGTLGVIVQVTLRLRPAFRMVYESTRTSLSTCLRDLETLNNHHRHFEFYWFPYADPCQLKFMDETTKPADEREIRDFASDVVLENGVFGALSKLCQWMPRLCAPVSRLSASMVPVTRKVAYSHRLFATKRLVRFNEMEYNLPAEAMVPVIWEMREVMARERFAVHFPIECRYAKRDDIWLSPAYGRDSAYIAVHMFRGMPYERYFAAMEDIFLRYGGRPHWGKLHTLQAAELSQRYPMWNRFLNVRAEFDPDGIFLNAYLRDLFGLGDASPAEATTRTRRQAQ